MHVDGKQEILAVHLHSVAGIIDDRDFGAGCEIFELAQRLHHALATNVVHRRDGIETGLLEGGLHQFHVIGRVVER
ncbi:hypothetical protein D9M70_565230 [compost metagenome]